jgi:hypothetical protein
VGATVEKESSGEETAIWTIVTGVTKDTRSKRSALFHDKVVSLKSRIPASKDGDVNMLSMWLYLYPSNIEDDLSHPNEEGFPKKAGLKPVAEYEWVVFIGIIYATRQLNQQGKGLWTFEAT